MIGFNVCYSEGAAGMCTNQRRSSSTTTATSVGVGWIADGVFANGTQIELTKVWSALAGYEHIWNPKWRTSVGGGYVNVDYNGTATNLMLARTPWAAVACGVPRPPAVSTIAITLLAGNSCSPDYSFWEAYTRTQWNPVPQLDIGLEVLYHQTQHRLQRPGNLARRTARVPPWSTGSSTTRTSGPRCSAGSATSIHDRLSDPGKLPTPGGKPPGVLFCPTEHRC